MEQLPRIGGHAQREVFEDTILESYIRAGPVRSGAGSADDAAEAPDVGAGRGVCGMDGGGGGGGYMSPLSGGG